MIPFAAIPWRLVGLAVLSAALIWGGYWVSGRLDRANEADELEQTLAAERKQRAADVAFGQAKAKEAAQATAREAALAAATAAIPKERLAYVPTAVPGQSVRCARLSADFVRAYNAAVEGPAD